MHLFLDDERHPVDTCGLANEWTIARSYEKAVQILGALRDGELEYISFDHDLGDDVTNKTGMDLARWLVEQDMDRNGKYLPPNFDFYVHSQNPVGKQNIERLLRRYLNFRRN